MLELRSFIIGLAALGLALLVVQPAKAGDIAGHQALGFSADAGHFAFVEFGTQDGSGAAYANLYILDLAADSYVGGSPFRVGGGENMDFTMATAIAQAKANAEDALSGFGIDMPALLVAAAPPTQLRIDRKSVSFHTIPVVPPLGRMIPSKLTLETITLPGPDYCFEPDATRGFAIRLTNGAETIEVHRDASIPSSRGCALDYEIGSVWVPVESRGNAAVALISVISQGFEGQRDRRFAAIPLSLSGISE
jgi:predicted secreted protein